ncbi:site-specific integrase [Frankia sp. B2]|uniref:hypothetical protein n=1 Tax=unclassified Frankia TaxID=2632575 RepID=UPI0006C9EA85|nr:MULTISPECIES: hypothetical protein [unclassified Frankia]KPM56915.1 hypothetical protein ACG83_03535 [Frankia sp. R43]TFE25090.1 site-specific integrase [Frankia sp. B2]
MTEPVTRLSVAAGSGPARSPFIGADVCQAAGFALLPGGRGPVFDEPVWDFTAVAGLPAQLHQAARRLAFTGIVNPAWQLVAQELLFALLAPTHPAVAVLPRALRTPLNLRSARYRLAELTRWLNWLTDHGVTTLDQVTEQHARGYLTHRRTAGDGTQRGPAVRQAAVTAVLDLCDYAELFTTDRYPPGFRPWGGAAPHAIAETPPVGPNKTPPVDPAVLQPMLAAALYLVETLGPHVVDLARQLHDDARLRGQLPHPRRMPTDAITAVLARHVRDRVPLPLLADHHIAVRLAGGWAPDDPLLPVAWDLVARQAGALRFRLEWVRRLRGQLEATLARTGAEKPYCRVAAVVPSAEGHGQVAWSLPLHPHEAEVVVRLVRTAAILVITTLTGMRASEVMELTGNSQRVERLAPGRVRYRLASRVIKGRPLGGTDDEWVVIEPVHTAAGVAAGLLDSGGDAKLFNLLGFTGLYASFRGWVNSPAGQRLGLAPIPDGPVNPRMLRRTLAVELAYRPGGVLATKIHLKHVSVATTEGYVSRPGGAQARLLAEVNEQETARNHALVLAEFHNFQNGIMPAGPGAKELTTFFTSVEAELAGHDPGSPKTLANDRQILNLLSKRAGVLHLGTANYCWFTDPAKALCLKLAGTPTATTPLAGMCDSARCPQATHHPCHRDIWADTAANTKALIASLGPTRRVEKARLQAEHDRATAVLAGIDAVAPPADPTDQE